MADPVKDVAAAEAFTAQNKHRRAHSALGETATIQLTFRAHRGKRGGQPRCWGETSVYDGVTRWSQCDNLGKVRLADGSTWCGVHSPEGVARRADKVEARRRTQDAKWRAKQREADERARKAQAYPKLVLALLQIARGHNAPARLAREVLAEAGEVVAPTEGLTP